MNTPPATRRILVRGSNDVGSAIAHQLFLAGYAMLLHDLPRPVVARRGMAFSDALYDGVAVLAGVTARRIDRLDDLAPCSDFVPVCCLLLEDTLGCFRPDVVVDARMRKRTVPEPQRHLAPLVIGIGPNFTVGEQVHVAVESGYGERLGSVVTQGSTAALAGEPRAILGHARDRYIYSTCAGLFNTRRDIGELVASGDELARIEDHVFHAHFSGALRGLVRDGAMVNPGAKIIEIDPRGDTAQVRGIAERPRRIAEGVLSALSCCA